MTTSPISDERKQARGELLDRGAGVTHVSVEVAGIDWETVESLLERASSMLYDLSGLRGAVLRHTIWRDLTTGGEDMSGVRGRISGDGLEPFGRAVPWWLDIDEPSA